MPGYLVETHHMWSVIASLLIGYFMGSVPYGLILMKLWGHCDIRQVGSGNIGATNVLRVGHRSLAVATLFCDVAKGSLSVLLGQMITGSEDIAVLTGAVAVLGHLFPVWLKFMGGKGVATYIGILLALSWSMSLAFCGIWLGVAGISRKSSAASVIAIALMPLIIAVTGFEFHHQWPVFLVLSVLVLIKHKDNLVRLYLGTEPSIGRSRQ